MQIHEITEAGGNIGIVLSNSGGKFYDISFVDYQSLDDLTGHHANLGKHLVGELKERGLFDKIEPYVKSKFPGKTLGEDYSNEDATFTLYGPLSEQQFGGLEDSFLQATVEGKEDRDADRVARDQAAEDRQVQRNEGLTISVQFENEDRLNMAWEYLQKIGAEFAIDRSKKTIKAIDVEDDEAGRLRELAG